MKLIIEIRAAEGGQDAKLLVSDQASVYRNFSQRVGASVRELDTGLG
jgi:protein subunit release factor A